MGDILLAATNPLSVIWNAIVAALNFMLQMLYSISGNYGVAIIMLTILVKLLLLPLTIKQTRSMMAMQKLQPEMKKIQEKYKEDKQKQSEEMMRLYRENKVNPLSGCLPLIMQMPIFIALYMVLRKYVITPPIMLLGNLTARMAGAAGNSGQVVATGGELVRNTGFLWIDNLSDTARMAGAAGMVLVVLLMASTWYSQKQVMTDPRQKNMMLIMPLLMGFIGLSLPTGVVVYWVTTNVLQILQQFGIQRWEKKKDEAKAEEKPKGKKGTAPPEAAAVAKKGEGKGAKERPQARGGQESRERTAKPLPGQKKAGAGSEKRGTVKEAAKKEAGKQPPRGGGDKKPQATQGKGSKAGGKKGAAVPQAATRRRPPPKKK
jgi:YidC/Oxa1 family membrane protein insertase